MSSGDLWSAEILAYSYSFVQKVCIFLKFTYQNSGQRKPDRLSKLQPLKFKSKWIQINFFIALNL